MKFPTSILPTSTSEDASGDGLEVWRELAQTRLDEPVIDACMFSRQGLMSKKLAGHFGALPYLLAKKAHEVRAAGLPEHFLLAVTPEHVYAIEHRFGRGAGRRGTSGEIVASWKRSALRVSSRPGGFTTAVTLESPEEGETVHCSVATHPLSAAFIRLLGEPAASA